MLRVPNAKTSKVLPKPSVSTNYFRPFYFNRVTPPTPKKAKVTRQDVPTNNPFLMHSDHETEPLTDSDNDESLNLGEDILRDACMAAAAKRFFAFKESRPPEGYRARRETITRLQDQLRASASEVATAQSLDEFPLSSITIASEAVVDFPFVDDDGTAHHVPDATLIRPCGHQPKNELLQPTKTEYKHLRTRASYMATAIAAEANELLGTCLLYTSPSPRDRQKSRMPSSA